LSLERKEYTKMTEKKTILGWREYLQLKDLGVDRIAAKVDTGAKTCALHAFYIEEFERDAQPWIRFGLHPRRETDTIEVHCEALIKERRDVTDSGGHLENRYVIDTTLVIGADTFIVEMTLTNRDNMRFRMLLGRNALRRRFLVDPGKSFLLGKEPAAAAAELSTRVTKK
jgi:hypothetical protein